MVDGADYNVVDVIKEVGLTVNDTEDRLPELLAGASPETVVAAIFGGLLLAAVVLPWLQRLCFPQPSKYGLVLFTAHVLRMALAAPAARNH